MRGDQGRAKGERKRRISLSGNREYLESSTRRSEEKRHLRARDEPEKKKFHTAATTSKKGSTNSRGRKADAREKVSGGGVRSQKKKRSKRKDRDLESSAEKKVGAIIRFGEGEKLNPGDAFGPRKKGLRLKKPLHHVSTSPVAALGGEQNKDEKLV